GHGRVRTDARRPARPRAGRDRGPDRGTRPRERANQLRRVPRPDRHRARRLAPGPAAVRPPTRHGARPTLDRRGGTHGQPQADDRGWAAVIDRPPVVFPDVEQWAVGYLRTFLDDRTEDFAHDVDVDVKTPELIPARLVTVRDDGGQRRPGVTKT